MYRAILVPLDGSPLAASALPFARAIARASGARLLLLRVATSAHATGASQTPGKAPGDAETYLADVVSSATDGTPFETLLVSGQAAEQIVAEARAHGVGLVVMATRRRDGLAGWVQGSVAGEVVRQV